MSEKPIQVGDLVMVVHWPHAHFGKKAEVIFTVSGFCPTSQCPACGEQFEKCATYTSRAGNWCGVPVNWLKRIEPGAITEDADAADAAARAKAFAQCAVIVRRHYPEVPK